MPRHPAASRGPRWPGIVLLACTALCVAGASLTPRAQAPRPAAASCAIETTERIVAVGDVHGAYDQFIGILRDAGLIDNRQRWTGGRAIFVQTGDVLDRGRDSRRVLDLLRRLEPEAARAGGRVIPLIGNHEAMRILGDMRYTVAGEYSAFRTPDSSDVRDRYYQLVLQEQSERARAAGRILDEREFKQLFVDQTPLGALEMGEAFGPRGDYGRWLRGLDAVVKINGMLFMHGGPSLATAPLGCVGINLAVRAQLQTVRLTDPDIAKSLLASPDGPLWYRGLVEEPPTATEADVDAILKAFEARAVVVGHTVTGDRRVRTSFGGRVIQIDTGMLNGDYFPNGVASALEIQGNAMTAIYAGGKREPVNAGLPPATPPARR